MAKSRLKKNKNKKWIDLKYKKNIKVDPIESEEIIDKLYKSLLIEMNKKIEENQLNYAVYLQELKEDIMQGDDLAQSETSTSAILEKYDELLSTLKKTE